MLDFLSIQDVENKKGVHEISPDFDLTKNDDLMIRGGDFYAIWLEDAGRWSTDERDVIQVVDDAMYKYAEEKKFPNGWYKIKPMKSSAAGSIELWHRFCQKQSRDKYTNLDETLIFSDTVTKKKDFSSKRLDYPLVPGSYESYDKLMTTLYAPSERHKIEWCIGAIVTGASKKLQKFMVLYGGPGTGKGTVIEIINQLFKGYTATFDAKQLGSQNGTFALEAFRSNPLVAIDADGKLDKIEDNTRLNLLISHEPVMVNEKFRSQYTTRFKSFLIMASNSPVKITDARSGLIRRLIDVNPTGNTIPSDEYDRLMSQIPFELGAIACHCKDVYLENPKFYDKYTPLAMMGASNDFFNFVIDSYHIFKRDDSTTLKSSWTMYKEYCDEAKVPYPLSQRAFKEELKNYFEDYKERYDDGDGNRVRSYYSGFRTEKVDGHGSKESEKKEATHLIQFKHQGSIFDMDCMNCPAQYASENETPTKKWDNVTSTLNEIDTSKLHYVKVPENHIVIDFDIPGPDGQKSFERNLEAASKWPSTYAELSKSGNGIHLHYIYTGDPSKLSRIYDDHIEVKVFTGKSSLRRMLTMCNNLPIGVISMGLPLKGDTNVVNFEGVKSEKALRTLIKRNLAKEIHPGTKPSIDFIYKILEDAYASDLKYDVRDMRNAIIAFAACSTHQADYCLKKVKDMKFCSDEPSDNVPNEEAPIVFYDVEVFPNLFLVNWKFQGKDQKVVRLINPSVKDMEQLMKYRLIGFNCRRYDNHMIFARFMGYDAYQIFTLSQKIIEGKSKDAFFGEAYNLSYTDVYDFCTKKQSLKKWEIELGIHHHELGLPWDQPVPKELWTKVAEYCDDDVIATEAVFDANQADFAARKIQVELVKMMHGISNVCVNDTTNSLSAKIIFGKNREPQGVFNWRDMSKPVSWEQYPEYRKKFGPDYVFHIFDQNGLPTYETIDNDMTILPEGYSILPFFPGYKFENGVSTYLDQTIGEGGRVYSEPGMYENVWDGDVTSQHPHSAIYEVIFGPEYTKVFQEIVEARKAIKHKDFERAGSLLGGALKPYLTNEMAKGLAQALKIVINSIYGLTSAGFTNAFKDPNNKDNIVAKRGALFMTLLKREVQKRGYTVAHIKTDSIKIPNATQEIMDFVCKFGQEYGYTFETEANFEKFCLVNDAVYVAKFKDGEDAGKWTATGTQFQVPYVFKTLFSKEPITFKDMCETKSVQTAIYIDRTPDEAAIYYHNPNFINEHTDDIVIDDGHQLQFVGKIGQFTPMLPDCGAGTLVSQRLDKNGNVKYSAVTGTKGYLWMESEMVEFLKLTDKVNKEYYRKLVDGAIETMSKYGDVDLFINGKTQSEEDDGVPPFDTAGEPFDYPEHLPKIA